MSLERVKDNEVPGSVLCRLEDFDSGRNYHQWVTVDDLLSNRGSKKIAYHEIFREKIRLVVDIDMPTEGDSDNNFNEKFLIATILNVFSTALSSFISTAFTKRDLMVIVMSSTSSEKISLHVVFPRIIVSLDRGARLMRTIFALPQSLFMCLGIDLRQKIDMGIYRKNHSLRILGSRKGDRIKRLSGIYFLSIDPDESGNFSHEICDKVTDGVKSEEEAVLMCSLVSHFIDDDAISLDRYAKPEEPKERVIAVIGEGSRETINKILLWISAQEGGNNYTYSGTISRGETFFHRFQRLRKSTCIQCDREHDSNGFYVVDRGNNSLRFHCYQARQEGNQTVIDINLH